jgi:hypothetical protein
MSGMLDELLQSIGTGVEAPIGDSRALSRGDLGHVDDASRREGKAG